MAVNRDGAGALAAAAAKRGIPFIHISTDYVFDRHREAPYREEDAKSSINLPNSVLSSVETGLAAAAPK